MATFKQLKDALAEGRVVDIPVKLLDPDPDQPRREFDKEGLNELAGDIKRRGVQQPLTVRPDGKRFFLVYGERRLKAAKIAKLDAVPAVLYRAVEEGADDAEAGAKLQSLERMLDQVKENYLRKDLTPVEWGEVFYRLFSFGYNVGDIPGLLEDKGIKKISRSYVSNLLRIRNLPKPEQKRISDGTLTAAHAKPLLVAHKAGDEVYAEVVKELDGENRFDRDPGHPLSVDELNDLVYETVSEKHINLDATYTRNPPAFDTKGCNECPWNACIKVTGWGGTKNRFCTKPECFNDLQAKAKQAAADKVRKGNGGKDAEGQADPDKPKLSPEQRREREGRKVEEYMQRWFRRQFAAALKAARPEVKASVLGWVTMGMRTHCMFMGGIHADTAVAGDNRFEEEAVALDLEDLGLAIRDPVKPARVTESVIERVAYLADMEAVYAGAKAIGVSFQHWEFDEEYLKCKMSAGLDELAKEYGIADTAAWQVASNRTNADKRAVFLDPNTVTKKKGPPKDFYLKATGEYTEVEERWKLIRAAQSGAKQAAA